MRGVAARYEDGLLHLDQPLELPRGEKVRLIVLRQPDANRWNLKRLRDVAAGEDVLLAEQGMADWVEMLELEDQR